MPPSEWVAERAAGAPNRLEAERRGLEAFIEFVRQHKSIYRIITEAEFVAPKEYREHYEGFARGYRVNMEKAAKKGWRFPQSQIREMCWSRDV